MGQTDLEPICLAIFDCLTFKLAVAFFVSYELFIPFSFFVFSLVSATKLRKCLLTFFKSLACLALQTETIVMKITQPMLPKMKNELTKICNEPGITYHKL